METNEICRICLERGHLKPIFSTSIPTSTNGLQISCAQALFFLTNIPTFEDDRLPQHICQKCLVKLRAAYKFKILYQESHSKFLARIRSSKEESETIFVGSLSPEHSKFEDDVNIFLNETKKTKGTPSHPDEKRYQCETCAKFFHRKSILKVHLMSHRKELPFRCTHPGCEKAFAIKHRLTAHRKVHTDEREFICHYCSHAARDKMQLTIHIRYFHTKEKNFLCGECGKAFVSSQARYYHLKRHENIRNHHCSECDKSFMFAYGLREHLITHTGEKPFACSMCDTNFRRKTHKENHELRVHGMSKCSVRKDCNAIKQT